MDDGSGSGSGSGSGTGSGSDSSGYEIYDLSNSDTNYINGTVVESGNIWTKRFTKDCEILMTPLYTPASDFGNLTVKVDDVRLHTGLLSLGVDRLAQFYVKADQTLSVETSNGNISIYARPLKSGGNFFIDASSELQEPFTSFSRVNFTSQNNFIFTAPRKTLFMWCTTPTSQDYTPSVKLNGMEIHWKTQGTSWYYDKLVLDSRDIITITIPTVWPAYYCALPLLEV